MFCAVSAAPRLKITDAIERRAPSVDRHRRYDDGRGRHTAIAHLAVRAGRDLVVLAEIDPMRAPRRPTKMPSATSPARDEAIVLDEPGSGLQRLEHAAEPRAARNMAQSGGRPLWAGRRWPMCTHVPRRIGVCARRMDMSTAASAMTRGAGDARATARQPAGR